MTCEIRAALCLLLLAAAPPACPAESAPQDASAVVRSPDGRLQLEVFGSPLRYRVSFSGKPVIDASNLGVRLADGTELGPATEIVDAKPAAIDASFEQYPGKRRHVTDRANEVTLTLRERTPERREWRLVVRAYDDGVALRYRFPAQRGWTELELAEEQTEFAFPAGAVATVSTLENYTTSHESRYERLNVDEIPPGRLSALPLLVELPGVGWAAVLEANLTDHAGLYLERAGGPGGRLMSRLSPRPDEPKLAVRAALPHDSPWRLILFAEDARRLLESDTVLKLNAPSAIQDVSWIRPGKTTFPWWNDYFETSMPFTMGLNMQTAKYYIDFCAEYGIPYHTLDGVNGQAWYGGPIVPYEGADITRGRDGLDLQEVIAYARQKGVRIRLWMHWQAAQRHMARAFPLYHALGIEGVMIDFMDRDDQEMVNFQRELLQLAADNRLTVTFHGVAAPTGLERTFPNLLNNEAVLNLEHDKWDERGVTPEHDVTVALTRMLAGPLDYHQGSLRGVPPGRFKARFAAPLVIGTPVRMLASYVVLQNHLPMMADYPSAYRQHPLARILAAVPATWEDTRALAARVGEEVAIARRSGNDWWIGAMTDGNARDMRLSLDFLPPGLFLAEIWRDDPAAESGFRRETREVMPTDELAVRLAEAGGALVRLTLVPEPAPRWRLAWSDESGAVDPEKWPAQRLGRWEVRAKLPAGSGVSSAISLRPDEPSPAAPEIVIVGNRGDQPTITSSAFHWTAPESGLRETFAVEQQTAIGEALVSYADGFHTFACEWVGNQLRFYVDDMHHGTFYNDEVGWILPSLASPMRLVIDPAIAVDSVRVLELADEPGVRGFRNGGFDENGGSPAGWHIFGNRIDGAPNVVVHPAAVQDGTHALKVAGVSTGETNYAGVSQGISIAAGELVLARLVALVRPEEDLTDTNDRAWMKIEFYNHWGDYFGGPAMLGVEERAIADAATPTGVWREHELAAVAPAGAVEARLTLVFGQNADAPGAVYIDTVEFSRIQ